MNYVWLSAGWIFYFIFHSVLAVQNIKELIMKKLGLTARAYRLIYSTISTVALVVLLLFGARIQADYFFDRTEWLRYISLVFTTFGVMTIRLGLKQYGFRSFIGFSDETRELKREGILRHVRHPILSGIILITIGFFLFIPNLPSLVSCFWILIYLPIGLTLEEKKLTRIFGTSYMEYKRDVPALIPRLY
jgi:protein-S-isoprenylcysteine O-methyltransferase Ste14